MSAEQGNVSIKCQIILWKYAMTLCNKDICDTYLSIKEELVSQGYQWEIDTYNDMKSIDSVTESDFFGELTWLILAHFGTCSKYIKIY